MLHQDIGYFSNLARKQFGGLGAYGRHDSGLGLGGGELSTLLGKGGAEDLIDAKERQQAQENWQLNYSFNDMTLMSKRSYREEVKTTLDKIEELQPHLKLYHTKGEMFWEYKSEKHEIKQIDIYRIEAPDGYCFDYEQDETTDESGTKQKAAHVKFIIQPDTKKQGNGIRLNRHVQECSQILFSEGLTYLWGKASRVNQYAVRSTRHGKNWRSAKVRLKDAHGKLSEQMIRLLATYLRQGWILYGEKEGEDLIALMSAKGIRHMIKHFGEDETFDQFKYFKDYEKLISKYRL